MITIQQNENGNFFSRTLNSHMLFQGTNASECFVAKCTWEVRHVTYLIKSILTFTNANAISQQRGLKAQQWQEIKTLAVKEGQGRISSAISDKEEKPQESVTRQK